MFVELGPEKAEVVISKYVIKEHNNLWYWISKSVI